MASSLARGTKSSLFLTYQAKSVVLLAFNLLKPFKPLGQLFNRYRKVYLY